MQSTHYLGKGSRGATEVEEIQDQQKGSSKNRGHKFQRRRNILVQG